MWLCIVDTTGTQKYNDQKQVKVKASHTQYRAMGQELILVYKQSARKWP